MKKRYTAPRLTVHGSVGKLTLKGKPFEDPSQNTGNACNHNGQGTPKFCS